MLREDSYGANQKFTGAPDPSQYNRTK